MSRLDKVMRELSDLRSFYLKLQRTRRQSQREGSASELLAEEPSSYNKMIVGTAEGLGSIDSKS
ncbi:MAG: hypothetical protein ACI9ZV_000154 [Candidatus Azotimanducaceae bacterium]|jgi:hypothetical protein